MGKRFVIDATNIGSLYDPIGTIEDKETARDFVESIVWYRLKDCGDKRTYDQIRLDELRNIGYYAGYLTKDAMARVFDLFETEHPYFGKRTDLTPTELLNLGIIAAQEAFNKKHAP